MKLGRAALRGINFTLRRRLDEQPVRVPVVGGLKVGISGEPFLRDIFRYALPRLEGAVIDVGANLGQTLCKVKIVDRDRAYYAFEPNAACYAYLERLVLANEWPAVTVFPCGLSDRAGMVPLHTTEDSEVSGLSSFLPAAHSRLTRTKLAAAFSYIELSRFVEPPVAFVKIDVEGGELEVLRGMSEMLRQHEPLIVVELLPQASLLERHHETWALLESLGYEIFSVVLEPDKHWGGLRPMSSYALPEHVAMTQYLAISKSKRSVLDDAPR
jgi:FkbM family methyltransferase